MMLHQAEQAGGTQGAGGWVLPDLFSATKISPVGSWIGLEGQSCPSHATVNLDWIYPSVTELGAWFIVIFISTLIMPRLVWYSPLVNFANISQIKNVLTLFSP